MICCSRPLARFAMDGLIRTRTVAAFTTTPSWSTNKMFVTSSPVLSISPKRYNSSAASSSSDSTSTNNNICVVDLRSAGWSLLERLCLEEFLAQTKTQVAWLIIGMHEPTEHRHLDVSKQKAPAYMQKSIVTADGGEDFSPYNPGCAILVHNTTSETNYADLNIPGIERDGVLCLEHSNPNCGSLGESIVLDHSAILTTLITTDVSSFSAKTFMTNQLWQPTFEALEQLRLQDASNKGSAKSQITMILDSKSCGKNDTGGKMISYDDLGIKAETTQPQSSPAADQPLSFFLKPPHVYKLGDFPIGMVHEDENETASIVRSVFWWNYDMEYFKSYLAHASPQEATNNNTSTTTNSILKLQHVYPQLSSPAKVMDIMQQVLKQHYNEVTVKTPRDMIRLMGQEKTSLQDWWGRGRSSWKIVQQFGT